MHKATFMYNKRKERFVVSNSTEHNVQVLIPGIEVDEVQVTSPRPFKVEILKASGDTGMPSLVQSKRISTSE